ncbi:MAG TPA: transposase [Tepidisphaeraceae bacterium]|jgi:putative transposase
MPRRARQAVGGLIYHVLNRAVGRMTMFRKPADYLAFLDVLCQAHERLPVPLLAFCVMPNHWHLVLRPERDGELSDFMFWLTMTHTQRWRHARRLVGLGPLYQGRFKAFPIQDDNHLLTVLRYVERNPLRAGLVPRAQDWDYGSLQVRSNGASSSVQALLARWPVPMRRDWSDWVNRPQTAAEEQAVRTSIARNRPFGDAAWQGAMARQLGLESSLRPKGRPRKPAPAPS